MATTTSEPRTNDQLEHALLSAWSTAADVGICAVDESLRVVMLNPAACAMLGVDGLSLLNQPFNKLVAAVNFEPGIVQWLGTPGFSGERHASCDRHGVTVDLLFKSSNVRTADLMDKTTGSSKGVQFKVIAITDITQLLAAQRHVNSESYRRQWQALNAGVVVSDARAPDMPIVYVNPMFEQMSGYTSSEVLGRNCRFLQGVDAHQPALEAIRTAIRSQSNGYAKLRNYRKDGSVFVNELFISPVKDDTGAVTHFVGIQHIESSPPVIAVR
jgi:PAS domain S-box-containing protein